MVKNIGKLGILSIVVLAVMVSCSMGPSESQSIESVVESVPVTVSDVTSDKVYESVYTIGEVKASDVYQVNAKASGKVVGVHFDIGDYVQEGDVLFDIETEDFEADKDSQLTQAANAVSQARIALNNAETSLTDSKKLFESGITTKAAVDGAQSSYDNARIAYNNAVNSYNFAKHSYETQSENYAVTAPVSGIISGKTIMENMFATNQNGFTIDVVDTYKIDAHIPSKYINDVHVDQSVEVYVPTLEATFKGHIASVSTQGKAGAYPVEIIMDEQPEALRVGMYTELWVQTSTSSEGLWIPSSAVMQENGLNFVYTIEEGRAKKVPVDVLSMRGDQMAIVSDLTPDQQLIIFGKEYVMDGSEVNIQ